MAEVYKKRGGAQKLDNDVIGVMTTEVNIVDRKTLKGKKYSIKVCNNS
jgi:hypothetical protein